MAKCALQEPETMGRYTRIVPFQWLAEDPDTIIATGTKRLEKFVAEPPRRGTSSWADAAIRTSATRWRSASL